MPKNTLIILVAIILVLVVGIFFLWVKPIEEKPLTVKIGMLAPLSGEVLQYGAEARDGIQLAISQLNQEQSKYYYELIALDDEANPDVARKKAEELVQNKEVLAVIGPLFSSPAIAAAEVFQREKMPMISPSATSPRITPLGDFIFRVCPSDTYNGRALADFVVQDMGFRQMAILWDEGHAAYSGELADAFTTRAEHLGGIITKRLPYQYGKLDFTSLLYEIKETDPEVIVLTGYVSEAVLIIQQARLMGWQIPFVGGDGLHIGEQLIEKGGQAVEGVRFTSFFSVDDPSPKVQEFVSVYKARYGVEPGWGAAHNYDAMRLIAAAIEKEGPNRKQIQEALSQTKDFYGVTGLISFDENGDVIKDIVKIEVRNGKFKVLLQ